MDTPGGFLGRDGAHSLPVHHTVLAWEYQNSGQWSAPFFSLCQLKQIDKNKIATNNSF
jgi:hypothetical protein